MSVSANNTVRPASVQANVLASPTPSTSRVKLPSAPHAIERTGAGGHLLGRAVGMQVVLHRAQPEVAARIALGLVAAVVRPIGFGAAEQAEPAGRRVEEVETVAHGEQRSAAASEHDRGGKSGTAQCCRSPVAGTQRSTALPAMSTHHSACSASSQNGPSPTPSRASSATSTRMLASSLGRHASSRRAGSRSAWATSMRARMRASAAARSRSRIASSTSRCASMVRS